jgi:hypothetical protein
MKPHPKLIAMRRRSARIRRTVATLAVIAFVALFATIYVQIATGNDPGLASTTVTESTSTTDSTTTASSSEDPAVTTAQS